MIKVCVYLQKGLKLRTMHPVVWKSINCTWTSKVLRGLVLGQA